MMWIAANTFSLQCDNALFCVLTQQKCRHTRTHTFVFQQQSTEIHTCQIMFSHVSNTLPAETLLLFFFIGYRISFVVSRHFFSFLLCMGWIQNLLVYLIFSKKSILNFFCLFEILANRLCHEMIFCLKQWTISNRHKHTLTYTHQIYRHNKIVDNKIKRMDFLCYM